MNKLAIKFLEDKLADLKACEKKKKTFKRILVIVAVIIVLAAVAYGVYKFFIKDDFDDVDEELYIDEDDIEELLEEDPEEPEPAAEEE